MQERIKLLGLYNFWNKDINNIWFKREKYLSKLEKSIGINTLIKVIIWQRRAWKSFLLKQLIYLLINDKKINPKNIFYLNLEYDDFSFIKNKDDLKSLISLYVKEIKPKWKIFLILDEIQEVEWWEKLINSYRSLHNSEFEIFISWSNSKLLSWELSTYLSWRYIEFEIFPFSFEEYLGFYSYSKNKQNLINYINFTGIPEIYNLPSHELQISFIKSLRDTIILKDIIKRYKIKEVDLVEKVLLFIINNIWNLLSLNSIRKKLKNEWINISTTTLSNYIKYMSDVFVIAWIDRFDLHWKRILEWEKKYYLNDLGFMNFLFSSFESYISKKLENYVYNYLKLSWYKIFIWKLWKLEIDFIAEKEWRKIYIQVAYLLIDNQVIKREYWNLRLINDSFEKYVVSLDDIVLPIDDKWIKHLQIWNLDF